MYFQLWMKTYNSVKTGQPIRFSLTRTKDQDVAKSLQNIIPATLACTFLLSMFNDSNHSTFGFKVWT